MFCLCEAGDVCLIPAPYYPAFDNDLRIQAGVYPVPIPAQPPSFFITRESLDATLASCTEQGKRVRVVLISNPSNPLGRNLTKDEVHTLITWCLEHQIHLISDEIYANSIYGANAPEFHSVLTACAQVPALQSESDLKVQDQNSPAPTARLGDYLHFVWGMSKDFGVSGFRVGLLYTENQALLRAHENVGYFCALSNWHQHELAYLLRDHAWLDSYLPASCARLRGAYQHVLDLLTTLEIPFLPAHAGMFVWVDLRDWVRAHEAKRLRANNMAENVESGELTWEAEDRLFRAVFADQKILMTPGATCHSSVPGFFRICFAAVPEEALRAALERLREFKASLF
eukprot:TRINITY_DN8583_c0_g1_i3.p1 TRINITY_DN8583_c0_g1~~TRINITY_DN8583_c0_g1_i3.p1  ORF type:complete len:342 (-),score=79.12 TRINITY_DN8583_c0_g1_i3:146-1171(-)